MKLVHPLLEEPITFQENKIPIWIIENQTALSALITEMSQQLHTAEGQFVLSENMDILPFHKSVELIINPFSLQPNNKIILSKLYKKLEETAVGEEFYQQTTMMRSELSAYMEQLVSCEALPLQYKNTFDITQFFKNMELQIVCEGQSLSAILPDYLKTATELGGTILFIFVNLKCFLSNENLKGLYAYIAYEKINVLLIENTYRELPDSNEEVILFDQDLCRII